MESSCVKFFHSHTISFTVIGGEGREVGREIVLGISLFTCLRSTRKVQKAIKLEMRYSFGE